MIYIHTHMTDTQKLMIDAQTHMTHRHMQIIDTHKQTNFSCTYIKSMHVLQEDLLFNLYNDYCVNIV